MAAGIGDIERQRVAVFTTVHFRDSIPKRVRAFLAKPDLSDEQAVLWAATKGKSTWRRTAGEEQRSPSGLGLVMARQQARALHGYVEILTGSVLLRLGERVEVLASPVLFNGTLARLVIPTS
jgi:hypothetical protein